MIFDSKLAMQTDYCHHIRLEVRPNGRIKFFEPTGLRFQTTSADPSDSANSSVYSQFLVCGENRIALRTRVTPISAPLPSSKRNTRQQSLLHCCARVPSCVFSLSMSRFLRRAMAKNTLLSQKQSRREYASSVPIAGSRTVI